MTQTTTTQNPATISVFARLRLDLSTVQSAIDSIDGDSCKDLNIEELINHNSDIATARASLNALDRTIRELIDWGSQGQLNYAASLVGSDWASEIVEKINIDLTARSDFYEGTATAQMKREQADADRKVLRGNQCNAQTDRRIEHNCDMNAALTGSDRGEK